MANRRSYVDLLITYGFLIMGIDPIAAAQTKLKLNELKYPVDRARGSSKKYDEL